jgi:LysM repeat protein
MYKIILAACTATLFLSGCQTYQSQSQMQMNRAHQTENQLFEQEQQRKMAGRIETLEIEISRVNHELDVLRQALETRYANLERKTESDKREMIDRLTRQLEQLLAQAAPAAPVQPAASANSYGYEHIVRSGETLSTIAKAYNVSTKSIIQANNIKNPNSLSIGQKLFIPE